MFLTTLRPAPWTTFRCRRWEGELLRRLARRAGWNLTDLLRELVRRCWVDLYGAGDLRLNLRLMEAWAKAAYGDSAGPILEDMQKFRKPRPIGRRHG